MGYGQKIGQHRVYGKDMKDGPCPGGVRLKSGPSEPHADGVFLRKKLWVGTVELRGWNLVPFVGCQPLGGGV